MGGMSDFAFSFQIDPTLEGFGLLKGGVKMNPFFPSLLLPHVLSKQEKVFPSFPLSPFPSKSSYPNKLSVLDVIHGQKEIVLS